MEVEVESYLEHDDLWERSYPCTTKNVRTYIKCVHYSVDNPSNILKTTGFEGKSARSSVSQNNRCIDPGTAMHMTRRSCGMYDLQPPLLQRIMAENNEAVLVQNMYKGSRKRGGKALLRRSRLGNKRKANTSRDLQVQDFDYAQWIRYDPCELKVSYLNTTTRLRREVALAPQETILADPIVIACSITVEAHHSLHRLTFT
ncbi:hypothetical protein EVAR_34100_1 [Eumeta japonica]|uniref:Uncharacterized protein n=1 Tax=Eumeta variegata TaxID=151549 RepID=A0A4C1WMG8_EUMVA|nr:hypothetical protein EVAR_34100_1 [Eumeta japonica]